jgi:hypothetical protein
MEISGQLHTKAGISFHPPVNEYGPGFNSVLSGGSCEWEKNPWSSRKSNLRHPAPGM